MRTGTIVSLAASAMLGLGALVVAKVWLPQSGHAGKPGAGVAQPAQATVPVVVATGDIPYGAKLDAHYLTIANLPASAAPKGAFQTPGQILSESGGAPIVLEPISAREVVLPTKLSGGGARPTVSAVITDGMRAFTVGVSDVAGGGGHVLPGDRVDVILSRDIPQVSLPNEPSCNCKRVRADVLLQNVRVLGMDLNHDPASTQAATAHTATLEVNVQDAEKLAVAGQVGTVSLALRRVGSAEVTPVRTIEIRDLQWTGARAPGARPLPDDARLIETARRALGPSPTVVQAPQILIRTHSVTVVHGDTSTQVQVPSERYGAGA